MRSHGKGKAQIHAARVVFYWCINKSFYFRKGHDFVKLTINFRPLHAQDCRVEVNILPPGQFRMKASAYLQERTHPAMNFCKSSSRLCYTREELQQGAFSCTVAAYDADNLTLFYLKRYIF